MKAVNITYSHGQKLFYMFIGKFTNILVKQRLFMTVHYTFEKSQFVKSQFIPEILLFDEAKIAGRFNLRAGTVAKFQKYNFKCIEIT